MNQALQKPTANKAPEDASPPSKGFDPEALFLLSRRLKRRRTEIEDVVLTRLRAISWPNLISEQKFLAGLEATVPKAIEFAVASIDRRSTGIPVVPDPLLIQVRLAAQNGIGLDTILRSYTAGHALFSEVLLEEAEALELSAGIRPLLREQATVLDQLIGEVSEHYLREVQRPPETPNGRRLELVRRLLAGEQSAAEGLPYEFDTDHIGAVAIGKEAGRLIQALSASVDARLLLIQLDETTVWAWLGAQTLPKSRDLQRTITAVKGDGECALSVGEQAHGLSGWRFTHRQAQAALPIARKAPTRQVLYADHPLLASSLQDDILARSLRRTYLDPLAAGGDGGDTLRRTLRAYLEAGHNHSSAGARLGVSRRTISKRLQVIEDRLGRTVPSCAAELKVALELHELKESPGSSASLSPEKK